MFNFLFQGNIGEMIAPIKSPEAQLLIAIQNKQQHKVHELLEVQRVSAASPNERGVRPMHMACQAGTVALVNRLLEMGADVITADNAGNTPLHYAARHGHAEVAKILVGQGARVEQRNNSRQTPYDVATDHVIRQYLLQLQLKAEAGNPEFVPQNMGITTDTPRTYEHYGTPSMNTPGHLYGHQVNQPRPGNDAMNAALGALMQPAPSIAPPRPPVALPGGQGPVGTSPPAQHVVHPHVGSAGPNPQVPPPPIMPIAGASPIHGALPVGAHVSPVTDSRPSSSVIPPGTQSPLPDMPLPSGITAHVSAPPPMTSLAVPVSEGNENNLAPTERLPQGPETAESSPSPPPTNGFQMNATSPQGKPVETTRRAEHDSSISFEPKTPASTSHDERSDARPGSEVILSEDIPLSAATDEGSARLGMDPTGHFTDEYNAKTPEVVNHVSINEGVASSPEHLATSTIATTHDAGDVISEDLATKFQNQVALSVAGGPLTAPLPAEVSAQPQTPPLPPLAALQRGQPAEPSLPAGPPPAAPPKQPTQEQKGKFKLIKPDGFHSSASDKALQLRYGHTKIVRDMGAPPTAAQLGSQGGPSTIGYGGGMPQPGGYLQQAPPPYNASAGSAGNQYRSAGGHYGQPFGTGGHSFGYPYAQQHYGHQQPPAAGQYNSNQLFPVQAGSPASFPNEPPRPVLEDHARSASDAVHVTPATVGPPPQQQAGRPSGGQNVGVASTPPRANYSVFNPATDRTSVVAADSTSNAVL